MTRTAQKALKGSFWSAVERFSAQGISFVVQILLARILLPSDYGLIGMLTIFIALSQSFIDSGFSTVLIQRQKRDAIDEATIFYFNIVISCFIYVILFFAAPAIGRFYNQGELCPILRILGLSLIINALSVVQRAILTIQVDFKTQSKASVIASILSGTVAVIAAYMGAGVWALVVQLILSAALNSLFLFVFNSWYPQWVFSIQRLRVMAGFGSKILASGLMYTFYTQASSLIIGKLYPPQTLGYYNRAEQFYLFPSSNICQILKRVYFPILCEAQTDHKRLVLLFRKSQQLSALVIFPLMAGLAAISNPLIEVVLTDKWIDAAWMLKLFCIQGALLPISIINQDLLIAIGQAGVVLKLRTISYSIAIAIILLVIILFHNITALILCQIVLVFVLLIMGSYYVKKYFGYNFRQMIRDLSGYYFASILTGICVWLFIQFFSSSLVQLGLGIMIGAIIYISIVWGFNIGNIRDMKHVIFGEK